MTIKQKILTFTITLIVICAVAIFIASLILFVNNINEAAKDKIDFTASLLHREIEQLESLSSVVALEMAKNLELANSIAVQDRAEMLRLASVIQRVSSTDFCTITDPNGVVLLRVHDPDNYGDSLAFQENIKSAISGNTLTIVEEGTAVRLSIRTGTPVYDANNRIVGIISVGYRLDTPHIVDDLKTLSGSEVTIFLGDERISTTVINNNGERAVGTKADPKISGMVLGGQVYIGKAQVLGRSALAEYSPLYGGNNKIIGMLFVGQYTEKDTNKIIAYVITALIITLIVLAASIIVAVLVSKTIEITLKNIIDKIKISAVAIHNSTDGLAEISQNLAEGSSMQAASIEETSATMNETESMVAQNAENTRIAAQIAEKAMDEVTETEKYMAELMETMSELKESSNKVGKIVKTIDDIAFQTNLLAINATVEAARAGGEAGRSFAVVAQEVRNLSQKSADASRETAEIIEKNIKLTDTSRDSADHVLDLAKQNAEHTVQLGKLISGINAASDEQASGVKQINIAVSQIEKQTQQNASMAEETTASSHNLQNEAVSLNEVVAEASKLINKSDETG